MKIAITADLHLKNQKETPERYEILSYIIKSLVDYKINNLIIAGDLFDKENQNYADFEKFLIKEDIQSKNIKFYIIPGNHDLSVSPKYFTSQNIVVINTPRFFNFKDSDRTFSNDDDVVGNGDDTVCSDNDTVGNDYKTVGTGNDIVGTGYETIGTGFNILFIPYISGKSIGDVLSEFFRISEIYNQSSKPNQFHQLNNFNQTNKSDYFNQLNKYIINQYIIIGHGDYISGLKTPNPYEPGIYMPLTRQDIEYFKPQKVFLGHIHKKLVFGKVRYPGSPCALDINEVGKRSFLIIDTKNLEITEHIIEAGNIYINEVLVVFPSLNQTIYSYSSNSSKEAHKAASTIANPEVNAADNISVYKSAHTTGNKAANTSSKAAANAAAKAAASEIFASELYIREKIKKIIKKYDLQADDYKRVKLRLKLKGYTTDKQTLSNILDTVLKEEMPGFSFYNNEPPDLTEVNILNDQDLITIVERVTDKIKSLEESGELINFMEFDIEQGQTQDIKNIMLDKILEKALSLILSD